MKSLLGALSVGSGLALAAAPHQLTTLFGLPRRSLLGRMLGTRDIAIGLRLLQPHPRSGLAARAISDVFDFGLIWAEQRHRPNSSWTTPRLTSALLSALLATGLRTYLPAPRRRGSLRRAPTQHRALLVGGAFLLAVTLARIAQLRRPTPNQ